MSTLTKNFSIEEMACKCGCGRCEMDAEFMKRLQLLRDMYGKAMKVTSGFRCESWNDKISGVPDSYHTKGRAADIVMIGSANRYNFIHLAMQAGMRGVGVAKDYIHVDDRGDEVMPAVWLY